GDDHGRPQRGARRARGGLLHDGRERRGRGESDAGERCAGDAHLVDGGAVQRGRGREGPRRVGVARGGGGGRGSGETVVRDLHGRRGRDGLVEVDDDLRVAGDRGGAVGGRDAGHR